MARRRVYSGWSAGIAPAVPSAAPGEFDLVAQMKVLRFLGYFVLVVIVAAASFAGYIAISGIATYTPEKVNLRVEVTPAKVERGRKYASMLCISCHLDPSTGTLTGKRLADVPASFGVAYSKNASACNDLQGL